MENGQVSVRLDSRKPLNGDLPPRSDEFGEMIMQDPIKILVAYQRDLFLRLDEFFVRATGKTASEFSTIDAFGDVVRSSAHRIASRGDVAFRWLDEEL